MYGRPRTLFPNSKIFRAQLKSARTSSGATIFVRANDFSRRRCSSPLMMNSALPAAARAKNFAGSAR